MEHYFLSDRELAKRFANCTLNPELFNHEAHLRLAWIYIKLYGLEKAEIYLCDQIQQFDATFGNGTKFHRTLTMAAAKMVNHFMLKSTATDFASFIREFPRLKTNFRDLLSQHYGVDVYLHSSAKQVYLEPDRLPFD
ncbi:MAG: hypothetical protein AAFQ98_12460 [Bacteroidota bacterium]